MKNYIVEITKTEKATVKIEAESPSQAEVIARDLVLKQVITKMNTQNEIKTRTLCESTTDSQPAFTRLDTH